MRLENAWSFLSPTPIIVYDSEYDAHLCFWNGVAMTRSYALMIVCTTWCQIWTGDSVKDAAWEEYNRIYLSDGFKTKDWDQTITRHNSNSFKTYLVYLMCNRDENFLNNLVQKYSAQEAMSWFSPSKVIQSKKNHACNSST